MMNSEHPHNDLWWVTTHLYFPARFRIRSDLTRRQYRFAVSDLEAMLCRGATALDLNDDTLIQLIRWMQVKALAPKTINERVGRLKTLANWLWRKGHIPHGPTVERVPEPQRIPRAWSRDELSKLFDAAKSMPGRVGPFRASCWWFALLATAWYTGERTSALLRLRWDMLQGTTLYVPGEIRKGGLKDACYSLPDRLIALLVPLSSCHAEIFHWPQTVCNFYLHFDRLLRLAGLPRGRYNKLQKVRRSHATWTKIAGGDPTKSLMHDDPSTTVRFYLDPGQGESPPELFTPWR